MRRVVILVTLLTICSDAALAQSFGPTPSQPSQLPSLQRQLNQQQLQLQSATNRQQLDSLQLQLQQRQSQIQRLEAQQGVAAQQDSQLQLLKRQLNDQQLQLQQLQLRAPPP